MKTKIMVFIPMYNCENQIGRVLNQFRSNIPEEIMEIVIVNNRSSDNGEQKAKEYSITLQENIKVTVLRNRDNYGLGGSHKVAINYAKQNNYDYLVVLHGDDQGSIIDLLPYIKSGEYLNHECLLGSRFHHKSKLEGYSFFRTFGNVIYNALFSIGSGKLIYDLGAGLNLYKTSIFKDDFMKKFPDDLTFNYCMILSHVYYKHKLEFFPLTWREDDQISNVKLFRQAFKVLGLLGSFVINKNKFLKSEHRTVLHEEYCSDIVYIWREYE